MASPWFHRMLRQVYQTTFVTLSQPQKREFLKRHTENAHAKRFAGTGEINEGLLIVDGQESGGLIDRVVKISKHIGGGPHRLSDDWQRHLSPQTNDDGKNAYLGGIKQAHAFNIESD